MTNVEILLFLWITGLNLAMIALLWVIRSTVHQLTDPLDHPCETGVDLRECSPRPHEVAPPVNELPDKKTLTMWD